MITVVLCVPFEKIEDATIKTQPASSIELISQINGCSDPGNDDYILLHEDHKTGELQEISRQQNNHRFQISNIQLNTSGVYCAYKQCAPQDRTQCCIRITGWYKYSCASFISYITLII